MSYPRTGARSIPLFVLHSASDCSVRLAVTSGQFRKLVDASLLNILFPDRRGIDLCLYKTFSPPDTAASYSCPMLVKLFLPCLLDKTSRPLCASLYFSQIDCASILPLLAVNDSLSVGFTFAPSSPNAHWHSLLPDLLPLSHYSAAALECFSTSVFRSDKPRPFHMHPALTLIFSPMSSFWTL